MTRRNGVIAALAAMVSLMSGKAETKEDKALENKDRSLIFRLPKSSLHFNLDSYISYVFSLNGETVELTPQEMMAALRDKP